MGYSGTTFVVGIGVADVGSQSLEDLFSLIHAPCGMAFIVVTYLPVGNVGQLRNMVACSPLDIVEVDQPASLRPDAIFVARAGGTLELRAGNVYRAEPAGKTNSIDVLFGSLARECKERAIGIALAGRGAGESWGAAEIRRVGGLLLAEEGSLADSFQMPTGVGASTSVEYVIPASEMAAMLAAHTQAELFGKLELATRPSPDAMQRILETLRMHTRHDFSGYKPSAISRGIESRIEVTGCQSVEGYMCLLESSSAEVDNLRKELLNKATLFFRDPEAFEVIRYTILPKLLSEPSPLAPMRAWVAGCSTGQEAYSLAIVLRECLDELGNDCELNILATDLDGDALEAARRGIYPNTIEEQVSTERLQRFFVREDTGYRICDSIRRMVVFAQQNLISDPPFVNLTLLLCRNVLIYLQPEIQERMIPLFHYCLQPGGILFLGSSEPISATGSGFEPLDNKWKLYRRNVGDLPRHADTLAAFEAHAPHVAALLGVKPSLHQTKVGFGPAGRDVDMQQLKGLHQRTTKELEAAVDELRALNVEVQSANEQLQIANEELETSKEEMQCLNEELQTVNAELHQKVDDLGCLNDDMRNFLNSTNIAIVFLDADLKIKRYTEPARKVIPLISTDIGRPLTDLSFNLRYDSIVSDAERVMTTLVTLETEVEGVDGHWYLIRLIPYRTDDNLIAGVVMSFVDVTIARKLRQQNERMLLALNGSDTVLFACDRSLRYEWAVSALFGDAPTRLLGKLDEELWPGSDHARTLRSLKEDVIRSGQPARKVIDATMGRFQVHIEPMRETGGVMGVVVPLESRGPK